MRDWLAVSDAGQGLLALLRLPEFDIVHKARMPFLPGRLAFGGRLFCADAAEPAIYRIHPEKLEIERSFASAPEIEALLVSQNGAGLFALAGGADSLQRFDAAEGRLLSVTRAGMHPRAIALDHAGQCVAVACGGTCDTMLFDAASLRAIATFPVDGVACGICFFAGQWMALCASGEYDVGTIVGAIGPGGKWTPWIRLAGLPGAMAACGDGLLVGHLQTLTMLDAPNGRVRWQTQVAGLPTQIVDAGRAACYADGLEGLIGLVDLRRGTVLRRLRVVEPAGLAIL